MAVFGLFLFAGDPKQRVARGVRYLDALDPGWFNKVDLDRLEMRSGRDCVLAQVTGESFNRAAARHGLSERQGVRYGFDDFYAGYGERPRPWVQLQREWVLAIDAKRDRQFQETTRGLDEGVSSGR